MRSSLIPIGVPSGVNPASSQMGEFQVSATGGLGRQRALHSSYNLSQQL